MEFRIVKGNTPKGACVLFGVRAFPADRERGAAALGSVFPKGHPFAEVGVMLANQRRQDAVEVYVCCLWPSPEESKQMDSDVLVAKLVSAGFKQRVSAT